MTSTQAKALARAYAFTIINRRAKPASREAYIVDMARRMQALEDADERKVMRWLGFIQGALWALGIYRIEQLKEHSCMAGAGKFDAAMQLPGLEDTGGL